MSPPALRPCIARATLIAFLGGFLSAPVHATHPLLTEDTGTQGAGNVQIELTHDLNLGRDGTDKTREQVVNTIFTVGATDTLDVMLGVPYARISEITGGVATRVSGVADAEIAAKWRFYDEGPLSFALRPGIGLPTGDDERGLGRGHATPSLFAVMTYAVAPWTFHLHAGYTRNLHHAADERPVLRHASVAAEYQVNESLRLVGDASMASNPERAGGDALKSMVLGVVYSILPVLDLDLGYRRGLSDSAPHHAWLTGLAWRF